MNKMRDLMQKMLSDKECEQLILHVVRAAAPNAVGAPDIFAAVSWARKARFDGTMFSLAMKGLVNITMCNGEPTFTLNKDASESVIAEALP